MESRSGDAGDAASWHRLESLYVAASGLPIAQRAAFLDAECSGNDALRREVDELLACSPLAASFFDRFSDAVHAAIVEPSFEPADPLVGTMLGHYRIDAGLGAGAAGTVYRAYDAQLQRDVALKLLSAHLVGDESARRRFLTEARAAAALDHPNICTIHETGQTDSGTPYIAMALCPGETLKARIARGRLSPGDALSFALQIARGLAAAHKRGITHRDVKPANVMVGEDGLVKLVDFGLARLADVTATSSGFARGTFAYMAPELLRGQPADARSDLWSFGVVFYEMLTGRRPFQADSDAALLYTIAHQRPEPIEQVQPDVPDELCDVVNRLLHDNPNLRYHNARDVVVDLEQIGGSSSPSSSAGSRTRTWRKSARSHVSKRWIAALAGSVVVVAIGLLALRNSSTPASNDTSTPRVAVLFFHDDTQDRSAGPVAGSLTGRLIDALAQVPGLDVPSLNALQPYRDRSLSMPFVADGLGAGWLIGGFVERSGDRLSVTAELSDSTGRRLDSRRVERSDGEEAVLIDETVEAVAIMLRARVGEALRERRWQAGTRSAQALALLRQARERVTDADSLVQRTQPRVALAELFRADDALARAASADPRWPEPLIERAWVARELAYLMFGLRVGSDSLRNALDNGIRHANAALELDESAARAYEVRGVLSHAASLLLGPDPDTPGARQRLLAGAERDLEAAVERDNTLARALHMLSMIQFARGDFEQARLTTERAYRADFYFQAPDLVFRLFSTAFETGQDEEAAKWCALIRRRFAESWFGAYCRLTLMTWSPAERANADTAWRLVAQATATTPVAVRRMVAPQLEVLAAGVIARAVAGDSAVRTLARVRSRTAKAQLDPNSLLVLTAFEAGVRVRLGQTDSAVALMRRYLAERPDQRHRFANSRIFNTLFADARLSADPATR